MPLGVVPLGFRIVFVLQMLTATAKAARFSFGFPRFSLDISRLWTRDVPKYQKLLSGPFEKPENCRITPKLGKTLENPNENQHKLADVSSSQLASATGKLKKLH